MANKANQTQMGKHEQAAQEKFLKEVANKGLYSVLEWADSHYREVAKARLRDRMEAAIPEGAPRGVPLWQELRITRELLGKVQVGANSTSPSANMMRNAEMQAMAEFADEGGCLFLSEQEQVSRDQQMLAIQAKQKS